MVRAFDLTFVVPIGGFVVAYFARAIILRRWWLARQRRMREVRGFDVLSRGRPDEG